MRVWTGAVALLASVVLAACGGSSNSSSGSSSGSVGSSTGGLAANQVAVTAGQGLSGSGFANLLTTSVTICIAGTSTCQTIDNVQVDTGSFGLRLLQSAITLPISESNDPTTGSPSGECAQFGDGFTWGTLATVDVKLGGETASSVPIQVITPPNTAPLVPGSCSSTLGSDENTPGLLGANGILGVGFLPIDGGAYYSCPGNANCTAVTLAAAYQVANPVAFFPIDNNGVVVTLASVPETGAPSASGTLTFGIATESNNSLSGATVIGADQSAGFTASYNGTNYPESFFDSGSSILFFDTNAFNTCASIAAGDSYPDYYCPGTVTDPGSASFVPSVAALVGTFGSGSVDFTVGNAHYLFDYANGSGNAFDDLAGPAGATYFDFGLPVFYGHTVYTAMDNGGSTAGYPTPFYGYK